METLAALICNNPAIPGVEIAGHEHKLNLFANDVLLYITMHQDSTPALLDSFAQISGQQVNPNILKAMNLPLSPSSWASLQIPSPGPIALKPI